MEPTKFLGFSRALWGMLGPTFALILEYFEVRQGEELVNQLGALFELGLAAVGPICWFRHWWKPDERRPALTLGNGTVVGLVLLVALSGALVIGGCVTFDKPDATPAQKLLEAEKATILALQLAGDFVAELGSETVPRPVRVAIVETGEAVEAMFPEVRAWVTLCATEEGCASATKVRLSVNTAKAAINEGLESLERICSARPEGCDSEAKVRLALVSIREAVDLVGRIVAEVMGDG